MNRKWVLSEARKADVGADIVVLENPKVCKQLDEKLLLSFWPQINQMLKQSGYYYDSQNNPEIRTHIGHTPGLKRSFEFMLFDEINPVATGPRAFFRGRFIISQMDWLFEREFFLSLSKDTDPQLVFEILGNSRFRGYPPDLNVIKEEDDDFYQIHFNGGDGAGWGMFDDQDVCDKIEKIVKACVRMYGIANTGITLLNIGEFLTETYEAFEAY